MSSIKDDLMDFTLAVWRNLLNAELMLRDIYISICLFYICSEKDSGHWLTVFPAFDPDIALQPDRPWAASSFPRQALWSAWECASVTCLLCRFTFTPQSLCSVRRFLEIHYNLKLWIQNEAFDEINMLYEKCSCCCWAKRNCNSKQMTHPGQRVDRVQCSFWIYLIDFDPTHTFMTNRPLLFILDSTYKVPEIVFQQRKTFPEASKNVLMLDVLQQCPLSGRRRCRMSHMASSIVAWRTHWRRTQQIDHWQSRPRRIPEVVREMY